MVAQLFAIEVVLQCSLPCSMFVGLCAFVSKASSLTFCFLDLCGFPLHLACITVQGAKRQIEQYAVYCNYDKN